MSTQTISEYSNDYFECECWVAYLESIGAKEFSSDDVTEFVSEIHEDKAEIGPTWTWELYMKTSDIYFSENGFGVDTLYQDIKADWDMYFDHCKNQEAARVQRGCR